MLYCLDPPDGVPAIRRAAQDQAVEMCESDKPFAIGIVSFDR
ncbi:hypothetical protein GCM10008943_28310 [Paenochrobactrum glaciei]|uniref:Uncharacterized protein n=1 Tax=Paenochrobactrum glaciei TaxID=486407 RepID=A0ABP3RN82_9HYPH